MDALAPVIARCDRTVFDAMVAFIAGLNGNAADHIGYFDTAADDIAHSLRELTLPVEEGFRLAIHDAQIVGVLGIETDPDRACWLPAGRHPLWQAVADHRGKLESINSRSSAMAGITTAGTLRRGTVSSCSTNRLS